jgi:site-specific DNA recombinase
VATWEGALDRYFTAFENGSLSGQRLAGRVEALEKRLAGLRGREEELRETIEEQTYRGPGESVLLDVKDAIQEALNQGTTAQRKALLRLLVVNVEVKDRETIRPTFRLPEEPVRLMLPMVGRRGLEPRTSALSARRSAS